MTDRYLFPEDEAQGSMDDAARTRRPKREFRVTTPEEMNALIATAIKAGTYDPTRTANHVCELCGTDMDCIHYKTLDGHELCRICAWQRGGCDCVLCERARANEWEQEHPIDKD